MTRPYTDAQHASQQHDLSLHSYYTSLLQSLQTAHSAAQLHDDTSLSLLLARLSTLLRSTLRSMGGEEAIDVLQALSGSADTDDSSPPSPKSTSSGKKSLGRSYPRGPSRLKPFAGFQPGATGGYSGTEGQKDWALEREMEIQRLEEENKALRGMLAIAEESPVADVVEEEIQEEKASESPVVSRKSSLTVEELEAGAEQEAAALQERQRAVEAGEIDEEELRSAQETESDPKSPGTGLGGGGGVREGQQRPILSESMLGFTAEVPPPEEVIDDRPEAEVEGEA